MFLPPEDATAQGTNSDSLLSENVKSDFVQSEFTFFTFTDGMNTDSIIENEPHVHMTSVYYFL